MMEVVINGKALTEDEVKLVVNEWYTNGMYTGLLQDELGRDLEGILDIESIKEPFTIETTDKDCTGGWIGIGQWE